MTRARIPDLEAVPEHLVAEIVDGALYTFARPGTAHTVVASRLGMDLGGPFDRGRGGPGPTGRWVTELLVSGNVTVSAPPFDAVPQDLGALWVEDDEAETPDDEG